MRFWFIIGIWVFKNWFFCDYILWVDSFWFLMCVLSLVVMRVRDSIFILSFWIVFFVIGFLFIFFGWLILIVILCCVKSLLFIKVLNLGVGLVLMMVNGLLRGWIFVNSWIIVLWSFWVCLDFNNLVKVYEVIYLCKIKIICCLCFIMFVVKEELMVFGGLEEFCFL